jgi:hypothetical protein
MPASRFCTQCGEQTVQDDCFCTHCGRDMALESESAHVGDEQTEASSRQSGAPAAVLPERQTAISINAPSAPAPAMDAAPPHGGERQLPAGTTSRRPWLAAAVSGLIIVVVGVLAATVLITTGGNASPRAKSLTTQRVQLTDALLASRELYASTQQPSYSALLPAGWQRVATKLVSLTAATTVQSPVDDGATITVGQIVKPAKTLRAEARQLLKSAAVGASFHLDANAATTLAGGRSAWVFAYDASGLSTAYYLVKSCSSTYAVSTTVPPARTSLLRTRVAIVAGTLQGNC